MSRVAVVVSFWACLPLHDEGAPPRSFRPSAAAPTWVAEFNIAVSSAGTVGNLFSQVARARDPVRREPEAVNQFGDCLDGNLPSAAGLFPERAAAACHLGFVVVARVAALASRTRGGARAAPACLRAPISESPALAPQACRGMIGHRSNVAVSVVTVQ